MRKKSLLGSVVLFSLATVAGAAERTIDFNHQIRPILSQNCFLCHGPDEEDRKGRLRLDTREGALQAGRSGKVAIVPGSPDQSEVLARITHNDVDEAMPPAKFGKKLSPQEVELLRAWIEQGAKYATHWAYAQPERPALPEVRQMDWPRNGLDFFILSRLEREKLEPMPEGDRYALARRLSLDITGLPPSIEEVDGFVNDRSPDAYVRYVDRLLAKETFGEHWGRMWLDLARYADSAGYADDPLRTIWRYRDYVIKAFNDNKPFDEFTIEQIAGDLLPEADEEKLAATAFHRNTMTNSEGGTNDEEFRNAAVVDRVNTTMAVWMGTSMACAQCHTHKYDPLTQEEYFQFMAFLNNTEDADRSDEAPTLKFYTRPQQKQREGMEGEISRIERKLSEPTPELIASFEKWVGGFPRDAEWRTVKPAKVDVVQRGSGAAKEDGTVTVSGELTNVYSLEIPLAGSSISALRVQLGDGPKAAGPAPKLTAMLVPPAEAAGLGRYVRVEIPGKEKLLSLAEVQVFSGGTNIAGSGSATQSSTAFGGDARRAIDGKTEGDFNVARTTHTMVSENPWWELDLKETRAISRIVVWNRTDGGLQVRLKDFRVSLLDEKRQPVWQRMIAEPPNPSAEYSVDGKRSLQLVGMFPDGVSLVDSKIEAYPENSVLRLQIERAGAALGEFKVQLSSEAGFEPYARLKPEMLALVVSGEEKSKLRDYYVREVATELAGDRQQLAELRKNLDNIKPMTVPIMRELAEGKRRKTHFQFRGNYLDLGREVNEAVPAVFNPLPKDAPKNRLGLAMWLVDRENPLTARVVANRFWEEIFGVGLVRTSEEFGSQGELPSHPELLDWLAVEFMDSGWNTKEFIKLLVTSAAYRQSSRVTPELAERDPENRLLARGPRFRIAAEMVRDQALAIAGLLSPKMYGPSVKPPQPSSGLSAAFGSSVDWKTSEGEDRFRRGLYTEWRRTSPYPSMSTFDAPNREVCTLRRSRTSTPLQALVTLNDPVYLEAAQGLARRMAGATVEEKLRHGFRLCVARPPSDEELGRLKSFYDEAALELRNSEASAKQLATEPLGALPEGANVVEMAALTTVANVLLNLDETLMKR